MHVIDRRASAGRAVYARKLLFTKENMIYIGKYHYLLPWRCPRTPRPHARGLREHILVREHMLVTPRPHALGAGRSTRR
jgi:hypothetical protein